MKPRLLLAVVAVVLVGACATGPRTASGTAAEVIELINGGQVESLLTQSRVPFFFDAEIIARSSDVELLWGGLREAGFEVSPEGFSTTPASSSDYVRVADTFDMRGLFEREGYLPHDAMWISCTSSAGEVLILVADGPDGLPLVYGIVRSDNE